MEFDENLNPINQPNDSSWGPKPDEMPKPDAMPKPDEMPRVDKMPEPIEHHPPEHTNQPPINPPAPPPNQMPEFISSLPKEDFMPDPMPLPDNHPPEPTPKQTNITWGIIGIFMIIAIVAIVAIAVNGDNKTTLPSQPYAEQGLKITETGKVYATPDVAKISFSISTETKDIASSQKDNSDKTASVKNELSRFNIASADIKTLNYSISPNYDYRIPRKPLLKGYRTDHSLEITVRKLEDTDAIVQALGNANITSIGQVRFTVDDITEVQNEAREEAIAKAKDRAKQLASLSGAKLGKIISIQENNSPTMPFYGPMSDSIGFGGGGAEIGLEEGSTLITSTITIIYSLK